MARPLRIEFPVAYYHVTAREDRREAIYDADEGRTIRAILVWWVAQWVTGTPAASRSASASWPGAVDVAARAPAR